MDLEHYQFKSRLVVSSASRQSHDEMILPVNFALIFKN